MLAVEDYLDALAWAEELGGLAALKARAAANLAVIAAHVAQSQWLRFLAADPHIRSQTSVCLKIVDPWFTALDDKAQAEAAKKLASVLEKEGIAFDIASYRAAPPGLRIWCGATVEQADLQALMPWLDWAFGQVKEN